MTYCIKIPLTITGEENGVCVLEQDVIVDVEYSVDSGNDLSWRVHEFLIDGYAQKWDDMKRVWSRGPAVHVTAPAPLHAALLHYMDEHKLETKLIEELVERRELETDEPTASLMADYHARVM